MELTKILSLRCLVKRAPGTWRVSQPYNTVLVHTLFCCILCLAGSSEFTALVSNSNKLLQQLSVEPFRAQILGKLTRQARQTCLRLTAGSVIAGIDIDM